MIDEIALEIAKSIENMDFQTWPGGRAQRLDAMQVQIANAMQSAGTPEHRFRVGSRVSHKSGTGVTAIIVAIDGAKAWTRRGGTLDLVEWLSDLDLRPPVEKPPFPGYPATHPLSECGTTTVDSPR